MDDQQLFTLEARKSPTHTVYLAVNMKVRRPHYGKFGYAADLAKRFNDPDYKNLSPVATVGCECPHDYKYGGHANLCLWEVRAMRDLDGSRMGDSEKYLLTPEFLGFIEFSLVSKPSEVYAVDLIRQRLGMQRIVA